MQPSLNLRRWLNPCPFDRINPLYDEKVEKNENENRESILYLIYRLAASASASALTGFADCAESAVNPLI
jgi:hypothetical protein